MRKEIVAGTRAVNSVDSRRQAEISIQRTLSGFTHEPSGGGTPEWYTPAWLFDRIGLTFDVDVCSPGQHVTPWIPARRFITRTENGLLTPWVGRVWFNPPYGPETPKWLELFARHDEGVGVVFSRTETDWFQNQVMRCDAICFVNKRIRFVKADGLPPKKGGPGSGSILVAKGRTCVDALLSSGLGPVWRLQGNWERSQRDADRGMP